MADDNDDQSLTDDAQGQDATGSKFATPKKSATSRFEALVEALPAMNEGENEFYRRQREMVETYKQHKDAPPAGKFERIPDMNEGEGEWFRKQEEKRAMIKERPEKRGADEAPSAGAGRFLSNLSLSSIAGVVDDVTRNVGGVTGLGQQPEGEAKGIDEKAKNVARYKKDSFTP